MVLLLIWPTAAEAQLVFVNEFHYDDTGADTGEYIEIAGPAGTDLTGGSVELYNGANGNRYDSVSLNGLVIPDQQNGYGVIGILQAPIQNGSPEGIALIAPGSVVVSSSRTRAALRQAPITEASRAAHVQTQRLTLVR